MGNFKEGPYRKFFLETKAGGTFVIQRKPSQTFERFKGAIQVVRSQYKIGHGIGTESEIHESHAVIKVTRDFTNPLPEDQRRKFNNPRRKDRQPGEVKTIYEAPKQDIPLPAPAPKPAPVAAMREDESAWWRELFKTSLASAPSADPTHHAAVAKAGVEAYRARFAPA